MMESLAPARVLDQAVQQKLLDRRERLRQALATTQRTTQLQQLLDVVAFLRMASGDRNVSVTLADVVD